MRTNAFTCAIALALCTALTACGKDADRDMAKDLSRAAPPPQPSTSAPAGSATTQTTPANLGTPSSAEKKEGANPHQQHADPKESAQRRDFQQKGDAAGPTSEDTKPKS